MIRSSRDVDYNFCFNGIDFVNFEEQCDTYVDASSNDRLLLCGNFTVLMQEPNIIQATLESQLMYDKFDLPKIDMIIGVPGCGKKKSGEKKHPGELFLVFLYTKCKTLHLLGDPIKSDISTESVLFLFSTEISKNILNRPGHLECRIDVL